MVEKKTDRPKVERKINYSLHLAALVVTTLIFLIGILFGMQIDNLLYKGIDTHLQEINNDRVLAVELMLLLGDDPKYCSFYESELARFDGETSRLGTQLEYLETEKNSIDS